MRADSGTHVRSSLSVRDPPVNLPRESAKQAVAIDAYKEMQFLFEPGFLSIANACYSV